MKIKAYLFIGIGIIFIFSGILMMNMDGSNEEYANEENKKVEVLTPSIEDDNSNNETYTMYVKINPLIKLTYKTICEEKECDFLNSIVLDYELVNDDAKNIYKEYDFNNKKIQDVLVIICDKAREEKIEFEKLEIVTDKENIDVENIKNNLEKNSKYNLKLDVVLEYQKKIDEKQFDDNAGVIEETENMYVIKFVTDGGSEIGEELIKENEKVVKPMNPKKDGYIFVEWQLNGKKYDFNSSVSSDITLKAVWKKEEKETIEPPKEEPKKEDKNDNQVVDETQENDNKPEKEKSTFNKINLNENITVQEDIPIMSCSPYVFENAESAQNAVNEINKLDLRGFYNDYKIENETELFINFFEITLKGDYENLNNEFNERHNQIISKVREILKTATKEDGGCGDYYEPAPLTEELCNKYNLTCDRW